MQTTYQNLFTTLNLLSSPSIGHHLATQMASEIASEPCAHVCNYEHSRRDDYKNISQEYKVESTE